MLFFGKKKKEKETTQENIKENVKVNFSGTVNPNAADDTFYIGVQDIFRLQNSDDLIVVGFVHGTINNNITCKFINCGDDDNREGSVKVKGLEVARKLVENVTDFNVGIMIENGRKLNLKTGSVLYAGDYDYQTLHNAYIDALGNGYISFRHMDLDKEIYDRMSLTDLAELRLLFNFYVQQNKDKETPEIAAKNRKVLAQTAELMCTRILEAKEIYTPVNKQTGEPHMYSKTYMTEDGNYYTDFPAILLIPKAYIEEWKTKFKPEKFELLKIEAGEDGKGIYNFLGSAFYLNGAGGVHVLFSDFPLRADMLVPAPDYSNVPQVQIPVTNPDLERWLLLVGQCDKPETPDAETIFKILMSNALKEVGKAKFLVPMKLREDLQQDENGNSVIGKGNEMQLATQPGKNERNAVRMYTDWKRLRTEYPESEGWQGMIQTIPEMINVFDIAINATKFPAAGLYIDQKSFDEMVNK